MLATKELCTLAAMRAMPALSATVLVGILVLTGCSTYRQHLNRGQRAYEENQHELALAIWRDLEPDMDSLDDRERARYSYLRGMTDYRLGYRADARHWLAIAKAIDEEHPGGLEAAHLERVAEALEDLNREVYRLDPTFDDTGSSVTETVRRVDQQAPAASGQCNANSDCPPGNGCQVGECVPL